MLNTVSETHDKSYKTTFSSLFANILFAETHSCDETDKQYDFLLMHKTLKSRINSKTC